FLAEIEPAARLQLPRVGPVFDSGDAAGVLWYTMPYVEGETLRARLDRERQLPLDEAVRIASEAARALEYAHQHGVLHRDIKPENLLLTTDGSTLVADFGIARSWNETDGLTATGLVVGTPGYMSPEQAAGERTLDARSDVYALGSVLYEMLAGEMPYSGPNAQAILAKRLSEPVPRLSTTRDATAAVLPFADLSEAKDQAYFSDGLTDELITALSRVEGLRVAGRTSSFQFRGGGRQIDVADVGRRLHVDAILEGSVRRSGNRLR